MFLFTALGATDIIRGCLKNRKTCFNLILNRFLLFLDQNFPVYNPYKDIGRYQEREK
jgi:hypothetical protein